MNKLQEEKLLQALELLKVLGLPKLQLNNRSAWVLLALADIRPTDLWKDAKNPLLPTVTIMQFIRDHYGMDYKPNSRETIRRQSLHQFEQARVVDRNRDDPKRATNSKDNNYSISEPILEIIREYPNGNWNEKLVHYRKELPALQEIYQQNLNKNKIPLKLPNGEIVSLSPGKHNQLHADIIHEFCSRFIGDGGIILYLGDTASSRSEGGKLMLLDNEKLISLGIPPMSHDKLPDVIAYDEKRKWIFLIEAVTSHGPISPKRWHELEKVFENCKVGKVYVTAFPDTATFRKNAADIAWETEVWIAEQPDHMIHFNGDKFLGPHQ
jgi:hypothetical protein